MLADIGRMTAWVHKATEPLARTLASSDVLRRIAALEATMRGALVHLTPTLEAMQRAGSFWAFRRERLQAKIHARGFDSTQLEARYARAVLRALDYRDESRDRLRECRRLQAALQEMSTELADLRVQVERNTAARRRGGKRRHAADEALQRQIRELWIANEEGRTRPKKNATGFAMAMVHCFPDRAKFPTVQRWVTEWRKQVKAGEIVLNQYRGS